MRASNAEFRALLLAAAPLLLAAASPDYCAPLAGVEARAPFCAENLAFVTAARDCVRKVDQEALARQKMLLGTFSGRNDRTVAAQAAEFGNHDFNLDEAASSLDGVVADARRARMELEAYLAALRYPGDPQPDLRKARRLEGYLGTFPCYHDRRAALLEEIHGLDHRISDLQRARGADQALRQRSGQELGDLGQGRRPASIVAHTNGIGGTGRRRGGSPSTITGAIRHERLP